MVDKKIIKKIKKEIAKRFPDFKGIEPEVIKRDIAPQKAVYRKLSLSEPKVVKRIFSLKFTKIIVTADKIQMKRLLLVTLNEEGEIIKISQSR